MKRPLIALAALGAVATTTPAFAKDMQVKYRDLNLATVEGQETLERRINNAAKEVCNYDALRTGTRLPTGEMRRCYETAKKKAFTAMAAVIEEKRLGG